MLHGKHGLAHRYALSLASAARKLGKLEGVSSDLRQLQDVFSDRLALLMKNPTLNRQHKLELLRQIVATSEQAPIVSRFFAVLADNNRLDLTPQIVSAFNEILLQKDQLVVQVSTAEVHQGVAYFG